MKTKPRTRETLKKKKAAKEEKINVDDSHTRCRHWKQILGTITFGGWVGRLPMLLFTCWLLKISLFSKEGFSARWTHKARPPTCNSPDSQLLAAFSDLLGTLFSKNKPYCTHQPMSLVLFAVVSGHSTDWFLSPGPNSDANALQKWYFGCFVMC